MRDETAALLALSKENVPPDIQELLVHGDPSRGIPPRALAKAIGAVDAKRAADKRANCKHPNKQGGGWVGSDGSSDYSWYCPECGASGESKTGSR